MNFDSYFVPPYLESVSPEEYSLFKEAAYYNEYACTGEVFGHLCRLLILPICLVVFQGNIVSDMLLGTTVLCFFGVPAFSKWTSWVVFALGLWKLWGNSFVGHFWNLNEKSHLKEQEIRSDISSTVKPMRLVGGNIRLLAEFKALLMLSTCCVILAVDFNTFPRFMAKTSTYGFSLMDLGVGCIVFATALSSPHSRRVASWPPLLQRAFLAVKSVWLLLVIGGARFIVLWNIGYHVPPDEYGLHWNFFFTVAAIAVFSALILPPPSSSSTSFFIAGLCLSVGYQTFLCTPHGDWFMFRAPRESFLSANREGVLGCIGYCSLHCFGICVGRLFFSSRPSLDIVKGLLGLLLGSGLFLRALHMLGIDASRRTVNIAYIGMLLFVNSGVLLALTLVDFYKQRIGQAGSISTMLKGIQDSMLIFFLLSNILTGAINQFIFSFFLEGWKAVLIQLGYTWVLVGVSYYWGLCGLKLKAW